MFYLFSYPLIHLPLLGSSSQQFSTPVQGFVAPDIVLDNTENYKFSGPRWVILLLNPYMYLYIKVFSSQKNLENHKLLEISFCLKKKKILIIYIILKIVLIFTKT